jgi:S-adenosylmethionine/arginine decarboxylase-like enzyme
MMFTTLKNCGSIVEEVVYIIEAKIVNISTQDYDPRGAVSRFSSMRTLSP